MKWERKEKGKKVLNTGVFVWNCLFDFYPIWLFFIFILAFYVCFFFFLILSSSSSLIKISFKLFFNYLCSSSIVVSNLSDQRKFFLIRIGIIPFVNIELFYFSWSVIIKKINWRNGWYFQTSLHEIKDLSC